MLGVFDNASFPEETLFLRPGDTLVAFSDGVTEALLPDGEAFGDERLIASAVSRRSSTCRDLLNAVLADVQDFCQDEPQRDDVTLTVMRFVGLGVGT